MQTLDDVVNTLTPYAQIIPYWGWLLLLAGCLGVLVIRRNRLRVARLQQELDRMRHEMRAMTSAAVGVGGRIRELERRQKQIKTSAQTAAPVNASVKQKAETKVKTPIATEQKPQNVVVMRPSADDYAYHPYDYAIQLARQGAAINDIAYRAGISQHEAKLIHALHSVAKAG